MWCELQQSVLLFVICCGWNLSQRCANFPKVFFKFNPPLSSFKQMLPVLLRSPKICSGVKHDQFVFELGYVVKNSHCFHLVFRRWKAVGRAEIAGSKSLSRFAYFPL